MILKSSIKGIKKIPKVGKVAEAGRIEVYQKVLTLVKLSIKNLVKGP